MGTSDQPRVYGFFGYRQFQLNRNIILAELDHAKAISASRPVQTEHGPAIEAAIRGWLEKFLPSKFGVTSGFIIPDLMVTADYKMLHYDVIIYDKLNSPILWIDQTMDTSDQGGRRAIPARYVHGVAEVKSSLTAKSAREAAEKLSELNDLAEHLPTIFSSWAIFAEVPNAETRKPSLLRELLPERMIWGFGGGVILRSALNLDMAALIRVQVAPETDPPHEDMLVDLVKDIDNVGISRDEKGNVAISEQGAGVEVMADGTQLHFCKTFGPHVWRGRVGLALEWSRNGFTNFAMELLGRLEGGSSRSNALPKFGQRFDTI